jgi:hypothetical protein
MSITKSKLFAVLKGIKRSSVWNIHFKKAKIGHRFQAGDK